MFTKAYFENIREVIVAELTEAQASVHLAVAWFTDAKLYNVLFQLCKRGVVVEVLIVDDEINDNSEIIHTQLIKEGGLLMKMSPSSHNLMHNKFCVIDKNIVINGSYNWTYKATHNHESITLIKGNPQLALDFIEEFQNLKYLSGFSSAKESPVDWTKVIYRLDAIKSLVLLEELELIKSQLQKLKKEESNQPEIISLIDTLRSCIEKEELHKAIAAIESFLKDKRAIQEFQDPEVLALKIELNALKIQLGAIEDEKTETEKLISLFQTKYNEALGAIILKILAIKSKIAQNSEERERAEEDFKEFKDAYEDSKKNTPATLSEEEKIILKHNFKTASKLCHPDLVEEKDKEDAAHVFIELKKAYDLNDKETVEEILSDLKRGLFRIRNEHFNEKDDLLKEVIRMRRCIRKVEKDLSDILQSDAYATLNSAGDWDDYFTTKQKELSKYLDQLTATHE